MNNVTKLLIAIWMLSLPFYSYSLVGTLSLDNILVPVILTSLFLREFTSESNNHNRRNALLSLIIIFLVYAVSRLLSVIEQSMYFEFSMTLLSKQFVYLIIPALFLRNLDDWLFAAKLLIVVAVIGIFSTLFASMGIVEFNTQRFAMSRFGIDGLPKSIGLLSNYGDMAVLGSFAFLMMFVVIRTRVLSVTNVTRWVAVILMLSGYFAAQSRNMYLTLLVCGISVVYFNLVTNRGIGSKSIAMLLLLISLTIGTIILAILEVNPLESAKTIGGTTEAEATVNARLQQYEFALDIILNNPILGNGAAVLKPGIEIHNIWLAQLALGGVVGTLAILGFFIIPIYALSRVHALDVLQRRIKITGLTQITCMFVAAEFYGAMTYIFMVMLGMMYMLPFLIKDNICKYASVTRHVSRSMALKNVSV